MVSCDRYQLFLLEPWVSFSYGQTKEDLFLLGMKDLTLYHRKALNTLHSAASPQCYSGKNDFLLMMLGLFPLPETHWCPGTSWSFVRSDPEPFGPGLALSVATPPPSSWPQERLIYNRINFLSFRKTSWENKHAAWRKLKSDPLSTASLDPQGHRVPSPERFLPHPPLSPYFSCNEK